MERRKGSSFFGSMKKILTQSALIGVVAGAVNALIAYFWIQAGLDIPFAEPGSTEMLPSGQFITVAGVMSFVLTMIGGFLLWLLARNNQERGIRIWRIIAIAFLVIYGVFPVVAGLTSTTSLILVNLLHLVPGIPAILRLPNSLS